MFSAINLGYSNFVDSNKVLVIVNPFSSPIRRLRRRAEKEGRLIDATEGTKTRPVIITDSNHVILSAIQPETLIGRGKAGDSK